MDWPDILEEMKSKVLQPRLFHPAKPLCRMGGQIKCFPSKLKLKELIITKPLLHEVLKGLKKTKIKTMNSKMTTNSQLSTTEPKKKNEKNTKQTTRTRTESQKWRSHGGLSPGRGENKGKGTGNKKHKW